MKRIPVVLCFAIILAIATSAYAQEQAQNKLGIGVSLDPGRLGRQYYYQFYESGFYYSSMTTTSPVKFYLPIYVTERFRLEPVFGLSSFSTEITTLSSLGTPPATRSGDGSNISLGLGVYYVMPISSSFNMHVGPRLALDFNSSTNEQPYYGGSSSGTTRLREEIKETDFVVGGSFGAEYFPFAQFSTGAEFQFNYTSFGNPDRTTTITPLPSPPPTPTKTERKQHLWSTDALFFVRWYFLQTNN